MSSKTKEQTPAHPLPKSNHLEQNSSPKLSDRYIVLSETFFNMISHEMSYVDWVEVRSEHLTYKDEKEDTKAEAGLSFWAKVYNTNSKKCESVFDLLVYIEHQQRLYSCGNVIEVASLIQEIQAQEAAKVITSPTI